MLSIGIVGLPNVGKSTLFNSLTKAGVNASNYPFCTIEPNVGVVSVWDDRLRRLASIIKPEHVIPATIRFVDIAGLVEGASRGEGLGNEFLGHIRSVDAICHVVRCFQDDEVVHVREGLDPVSDLEIIETELLLADLELAERRLDRLERTKKSGDAAVIEEYAQLQQLIKGLSEGIAVRQMVSRDEAAFLKSLGFLTSKPIIIVANVSEDDLSKGVPEELLQFARKQGFLVVPISAKFEAELAELPEEDVAEFLELAGLTQSGLIRLSRAAYDVLGLITFFTITGGKEVRAWAVTQGIRARSAAGEVHSDMERGFIRADVISVEGLEQAGSFAEGRSRGLVRTEGSDYVVQDGDILHVRFNV